jgi:hypothetical protein
VFDPTVSARRRKRRAESIVRALTPRQWPGGVRDRWVWKDELLSGEV